MLLKEITSNSSLKKFIDHRKLCTRLSEFDGIKNKKEQKAKQRAKIVKEAFEKISNF